MAKLIEKVYGEALFELAVEEKRMDDSGKKSKSSNRCFPKIPILKS